MTRGYDGGDCGDCGGGGMRHHPTTDDMLTITVTLEKKPHGHQSRRSRPSRPGATHGLPPSPSPQPTNVYIQCSRQNAGEYPSGATPSQPRPHGMFKRLANKRVALIWPSACASCASSASFSSFSTAYRQNDGPSEWMGIQCRRRMSATEAERRLAHSILALLHSCYLSINR